MCRRGLGGGKEPLSRVRPHGIEFNVGIDPGIFSYYICLLCMSGDFVSNIGFCFNWGLNISIWCVLVCYGLNFVDFRYIRGISVFLRRCIDISPRHQGDALLRHADHLRDASREDMRHPVGDGRAGRNACSSFCARSGRRIGRRVTNTWCPEPYRRSYTIPYTYEHPHAHTRKHKQ